MASESFRILGVPETLVSDLLWVLLGFWGSVFLGTRKIGRLSFDSRRLGKIWCVEEPRLT